MSDFKDCFALVTGASQGLGRAFAVELAKRGFNIILVSLPDEALPEVAHNLRKQFGVKVACYESDLTVHENLLAFGNWVNLNFDVFLLINNAGKGGSQSFIEASAEYLNSIIQLNVKVTSLLTHQLLPNLLRQEKAFVLNVSSLAAFTPLGYKTVYPASKVFVDYFSRGLKEELKKTGVMVSVVHPGAMKTNSEIIRRIHKQGLMAKLCLQTPERVAAASLNRILLNKKQISVNPVSSFVLKIIPLWIRLPLLSNIIKRELQS